MYSSVSVNIMNTNYDAAKWVVPDTLLILVLSHMFLVRCALVHTFIVV